MSCKVPTWRRPRTRSMYSKCYSFNLSNTFISTKYHVQSKDVTKGKSSMFIIGKIYCCPLDDWVILVYKQILYLLYWYNTYLKGLFTDNFLVPNNVPGLCYHPVYIIYTKAKVKDEVIHARKFFHSYLRKVFGSELLQISALVLH